MRAARRPAPVRPVTIRLERLPAALHGFSIVQLTDIHVGPTIGRRFVEDVVARTNALEPDLVAITGDLVDGHVSDLAESIAPLAQLRARHGVFFVTGNHEYFSGADAWVNELTRMGIRVLQNERVVIGNGVASFDLAGVDDPSAVHYGGLPPNEAVARALAGRDPTRELVLLAHQPRSALDAAPFGVGLQLSGHTHGGQLWPFGLIVLLQQPFTAGLHRHGQSQVYVSRGTGYWGPPMRLAAPSEITHLRLESARAAVRDQGARSSTEITTLCGLAAPNEGDGDPGADLLAPDDGHHLGRGGRLPFADGGDDVARAQAGAGRGRPLPDPTHERALRRQRAEAGPIRGRQFAEVLQRDTDVRMVRVPVFDDLLGDPADAIDRNRVGVTAARPGADERRQPDDLPFEIHQRAARVARVDLGVGQQEPAAGRRRPAPACR